ELCKALDEWHIGRVIRAYRCHDFHGPKPLSQDVVAGWLNLTQTQISRIESGPAVTDLQRLVAWATTLQIPPDKLWFKIPPPPERTHDASGASFCRAPVSSDAQPDSNTAVQH